MHDSHVSFYKRYLKLLEEELICPNSYPTNEIQVQPKNILHICCDLPIWGLLSKDRNETIYIIAPSDNLILRYNTYISGLINNINNGEKISITTITDPDTNIVYILYIG
jgi:hypothetical protein